jgi:hypothetical protein
LSIKIRPGTRLTPGIRVQVSLPPAAYTVTPTAYNVNEGTGVTLDVTTLGVPNGTTLYWTTEGTDTNNADFVATSGTVTINSGTGSFTVTPAADLTTEPGADEGFIVAVRTGSTSGTIVGSSAVITINDTSLTPPVPSSGQFNQPESDYLSVPAGSYLNLGTTWTVEFSIYMNYSSNGVANQQGGIWGVLNQNGWATLDSINVALSGGLLQVNLGNNTAYNNLATSEPVPQQWVHVAIVNNAGTVKVYYNGTQQVQIAGPNMPNGSGTGSWTNSTDALFIGSLGNGNSYGGNTFDGKITNVRITDTAEYTSNFTPTLLPVNIPGHTRLLWTPSDQALATDTSDTPHAITNNGVTLDASYPAANSTRGSAVFGASSFMQVGTAGSTPWALGTTWTIEWWQKATNATTVSGLYSVMGQRDGTSVIDIYYQSGNLHAGNSRAICAEPPVGQWVHVAMVTSNGSVKVYYDGVAQSVNAMNYNLQDSALALYIGCRGNNLFQNFIGKLTNIRITDTEVYAGNFTPDVLPAVIVDHTKLLYTPTVDTMYKLAAGGLPIATRQIAYSTEYPQFLIGVVHPYNGGTFGTIYCVAANPKFAVFQTIPVGARITSNLAGFGTRTVSFRQASGGDWSVSYDATGLTGFTSDTDTFNFYWG